MMRVAAVLFLTGISLSLSAQRIDNTASYRTIQADRYFRIHYENDYFSKTDLYYTQGINFEFVHPAIGNFFTSKLLIQSRKKQMKFGLSVEHLGYTPTSISHAEILKGDRPFAATLFLKQFAIMNDFSRHHRLVSSMSVGILGPAAGGEQIQTLIHTWIHDEIPLGWDHQIQNDVVLNYQVDVEKSLTPHQKYYAVHAKMTGRIGTFSDKASGSIIIMAGLFDNPFEFTSESKNKFRLYVYAEPIVSVVGYDATLQGGVFKKSSSYTIASSDITRMVFQCNAGLVVKVRNTYLEYFQSYLTKEFETGDTHQWGGIRLGWSF
jgi:lipid A 3-O-deacylase